MIRCICMHQRRCAIMSPDTAAPGVELVSYQHIYATDYAIDHYNGGDSEDVDGEPSCEGDSFVEQSKW